MVITVDAGLMHKKFAEYNRDYFSWEGLETLLEFYDSINENMELDVIGICCECSEYGDINNCSLSFDDLISEYEYLYPIDEWLEDEALTKAEFDTDLYIEALIERLEGVTTVLHVPSGNYIVFNF